MLASSHAQRDAARFHKLIRYEIYERPLKHFDRAAVA
jgi:hypothetical protein